MTRQLHAESERTSHSPTRRSFTKGALSSLLLWSLLESVTAADAFGKGVRSETEQWVKEVEEIARSLKGRELSQTGWQSQLEALFSRVDLPDLMELIDFRKLSRGMTLPDDQAGTRMVHFPAIKGWPKRTTFIKKVFGLKQGRAIIPHGHRNMVSGHLVIKGEMHVRHFERLRNEPEHLIVRPTIDRMVIPGEGTTISDERDNIHWFVAKNGPAWTFDIILLDMNPDLDYEYAMDFVDPDNAFALGDGTYRTPIITVEDGISRYGKQ